MEMTYQKLFKKNFHLVSGTAYNYKQFCQTKKTIPNLICSLLTNNYFQYIEMAKLKDNQSAQSDIKTVTFSNLYVDNQVLHVPSHKILKSTGFGTTVMLQLALD